MELTISGFWSTIVIIFAMSILLFIVTKNSDLYCIISPTTVMLCGMLILLRMILPYEFLHAKELYIPQIFPALDTIVRYEIVNENGLLITVGTIILFTWGIGVGIKVYQLVRDYIKMHRIVYLCERIDGDLSINIKKMQEKANIPSNRITYKVSALHNNPFIFGIVKPTIVLPSNIILCPENELLMVLQHEWSHFRRKDCIIKIILEGFCSIFWWLPFIGHIKIRLNEAMEVRADWYVIKDMQDYEKTEYMILLCELSKSVSKNQHNIILSNTFINGQVSTMEKRFDFISNISDWGFKNILLFLLSVIIFISSYLVVLEPRYTPDDGTVNCRISCYLYKQGNDTYDVYMDGDYIATTDDISFVNSTDFKNIEVKIFKEAENE